LKYHPELLKSITLNSVLLVYVSNLLIKELNVKNHYFILK
jgi:hypothetical protein